MKKQKLEIKYVPVNEVNPAAYNPRDITDAAFEGLKESIRKFGFVEPLIINTKTGVLCGGHQRLKAAQALELEKVPVVYVELTPAEEKALNITLNNQKISGYYTDALQTLIQEVRDELGDIYLDDLQIDDLVIADHWDDGTEQVENTEENLDGIKATIKVRCPQDLKDEVLIYLKAKLMETSFEGVEVV